MASSALVVGTGCNSGVAPSKTATGAGVGAATGAVLGGVGAGATGGNTSVGLLGGAAAGALVGGVIGLVQDAKERKEQDRLAQERAYQQELSRRRSEEAKRKAEVEEELAVTQGFRISEIELSEAQKKLDSASDRLKKLRDERTAALTRKKSLDEANERLLATEAEIARLEEELTRLKGDEAVPPPPATTSATTAPSTANKPNI